MTMVDGKRLQLWNNNLRTYIFHSYKCGSYQSLCQTLIITYIFLWAEMKTEFYASGLQIWQNWKRAIVYKSKLTKLNSGSDQGVKES